MLTAAVREGQAKQRKSDRVLRRSPKPGRGDTLMKPSTKSPGLKAADTEVVEPDSPMENFRTMVIVNVMDMETLTAVRERPPGRT